MRKDATLNMTEGKPLALLTVFAVPLLIGNLFQQAYNLADSMIVGRMLGADALAAVGATGSVSFLFFSIFSGICGGCGIVTAQYFGAGKAQLVRKAIANSAYITLASSALMGLFVRETDVIRLGSGALRITSLFYAFLGVIYVSRGVLNGVGDAGFSFINGIVEIVGRIGLPLLLLRFTGAAYGPSGSRPASPGFCPV